MTRLKPINTALVSVFHKDGLDEILKKLNDERVKLLSTGGTQKFIESLGYECTKVEEITSYPSILGGRVKTLHPKIFGGILGRRELQSDINEMKKYDIPAIDLVIVDLYPFEDEYPDLLKMLEKQGANSSIDDRRHFAERAFATSSHYDNVIHNYFATIR